MNNLSANWITEGIVDFEYKKYILLGYLKAVRENFDEKKLYPILSDLVFHYNNIVSLKKNKELASKKFPRKLTRLDFESFTTSYEKMIHDDATLEELEQIIQYSIPKIKESLNTGTDIYEFVEDKIKIEPIGIIPLSTESGYMFINEYKSRITQAFSYRITIFENVEARYRGIRTSFIGTYVRSISNTIENIKINLLKDKRDLAAPATYLVECGLSLPFKETLLPIAKRSLVRWIANSEGTA